MVAGGRPLARHICLDVVENLATPNFGATKSSHVWLTVCQIRERKKNKINKVGPGMH